MYIIKTTKTCSYLLMFLQVVNLKFMKLISTKKKYKNYLYLLSFVFIRLKLYKIYNKSNQAVFCKNKY